VTGSRLSDLRLHDGVLNCSLNAGFKYMMPFDIAGYGIP